MRKARLILSLAAAAATLAAYPARAAKIDRRVGKAELGMPLEKAQRKLAAVQAPSELASDAEKGDVVFLLPKAKPPKGAIDAVGHFRSGKLISIKWTYPPERTARLPWDKLVAKESKRYGPADLGTDSAQWTDDRTRLSYRRSMGPAGLSYLGRLDDLEAALGVRPETGEECRDFAECYRRAGAALGQGRCAEAMQDYDRALEFKPDPWAYHDRGELKRAMGDEGGARSDLEKARARSDASPGFHHEKPAESDQGPKQAWSCK